MGVHVNRKRFAPLDLQYREKQDLLELLKKVNLSKELKKVKEKLIESMSEDADAILIATEWPEFRTPDFEKLSGTVKSKVIFDGRNVYEVEQMEKKGFHYESIGRPLVNQPKLV